MAVPAGITSAPALWIEAREQPLADGTVVTSLLDQSGGGRDAAQGALGQRATYRTAGINGQPSYQFDGQDDVYLVTSLTFRTMFANASGFTLVAIARDTSPATTVNERLAVATRGDVNNSNRFGILHGGTNLGAGSQATTTARRLDTDAVSDFIVTTVDADPVLRIAMVDWTNGVGYHHKNGQNNSISPFTSTGSSDPSVALGFGIGGQPNNTFFFGGHISLIAGWPAMLSAAQIAELRQHASSVYSIATASSTGHAQLNWTAPASVGGSPITGYQVERSRGAGAFTIIGTPTSTSYLDTAPAIGDQYRVAAVNASGAGPYTAAGTYSGG